MKALKVALLAIIFLITRFITQQWLIEDVQARIMDSDKDTVFQTKRITVFQNLKSARKTTITIREINHFNKRFLPPFSRVNFEFFSLSQSHFFINQMFSRSEYQEMIHRVGRLPRTDDSEIVVHDEPILKAIVREFNIRNDRDMMISKMYVTVQDKGTGIHWDQWDGTRLWIPLTISLIDNLCLGVGDVTNLAMENGNPLDRIVWYQQMTMTSEDWIFVDAHRTPHYAANLGKVHSTQKRSALVINLKSAV